MFIKETPVPSMQWFYFEPSLLSQFMSSISNYSRMSAVTITHGPLLRKLSVNMRKGHQYCLRPWLLNNAAAPQSQCYLRI